MKVHLDHLRPFNLDVTLSCGQSFRWGKLNGWWYGVVGGNVVKIRQAGSWLEFEGADVSFIEKYFGLHDDLPTILLHISKDEHMRSVVKGLSGLRILRQNPWECLISYICATNRNIPSVRQAVFNLSKRFGDEVMFEKRSFHTFPQPVALAKASIGELVRCGLGYRARYVSEVARMVHEGDFTLESLRGMSYDSAKLELLKLPGVGPKVADCVLLFSIEKLEAFPVDVWIKRTILSYYADHFEDKFIEKISTKRSLTKAEYEKLSFFGRTYFGKYAGYAQEYLYCFGRMKSKLSPRP